MFEYRTRAYLHHVLVRTRVPSPKRYGLPLGSRGHRSWLPCKPFIHRSTWYKGMIQQKEKGCVESSRVGAV